MKLKLYHLFYISAFLPIIAGFYLTSFKVEKSTAVVPGWHTTIYIDYWSNLIPIGIYFVVLGLIYRYMGNKLKPISKVITVAHLALTIFAFVLCSNLSSIVALLSDPILEDIAHALGVRGILLIFSGPIVLVISIIVFIIGIWKANKTGN